MAREYFCAYFSYLENIKRLDDSERGRLFTACLNYAMSGIEPQLTGNESFVWDGIRGQIDRDNKKYDEFCQKRSENANKRWNPDAEDSMQVHASASNEMQVHRDHAKEKEKEKEKEKDILRNSADKPHKFIKPTVEQIQAYCKERNNNIDAQYFFDRYETNGWMVGKTPMKNWQASVRTWEKNDQTKSKPQEQKPNADQSKKRIVIPLDENGNPL